MTAPPKLSLSQSTHTRTHNTLTHFAALKGTKHTYLLALKSMTSRQVTSLSQVARPQETHASRPPAAGRELLQAT